MLDTLIRGGFVVDGSGSPRRRADVGIADGRVVSVGEVDDSAREVVDADGRAVIPGFVDVHTHFDAQVFWDASLTPSPLHGVTSVMAGNCGFTIAPLRPDAADYLMRMLAKVEGMPLESLQQGVPWDWSTTAEYLDRVEARHPAINIGFSVGHSAMRRVVMGEAATERAATVDEVDAMCRLLREGLQAGGMGFTSTWSESHIDGEGRPVPSRYADMHELLALAAVCRDFPGTSLEFLARGKGDFSQDEVDVMIGMSAAAQRPLNWNILEVRASSLPDAMRRLEVGTLARERGAKVVGLTTPKAMAGRFNFRSGMGLDVWEGWAELIALPLPERLAALRSTERRRSLEEASRKLPAYARQGDWGAKVIVETFTPETKRFEGRLVADIAAEQGMTPFDALLDIVCTDGLRTSFINAPLPEGDEDWQARVQVWRDRRALIGASDAGAHLDMIATFNNTTEVLRLARERSLMPFEEAVHLLTQLPADLYGLAGRGRLAVGSHADVALVDETTVASEPPHTRYDLPGGAGRLYAGAVGVHGVWVAGERVVVDGELTEARPGSVMRSGRDTVTPSLD